MDRRVSRLEDFAQDARERLARMETRMDTFATKEDLANLKADLISGQNKIIMWIVGAAILAPYLPALLKKFGL